MTLFLLQRLAPAARGLKGRHSHVTSRSRHRDAGKRQVRIKMANDYEDRAQALLTKK